MKTCAFTGHRPKSLPWGYDENNPDCVKFKKVLEAQIRRLIKKGALWYVSGMAEGIDTIATEIILRLKDEFPLSLECVIPHKKQAAKWSAESRDRYFDIISRCDKETLLQANFTRDCFDKRNKYMLSKANIVLAVSLGTPRSGTVSTLRQAILLGKEVININPATLEIVEM